MYYTAISRQYWTYRFLLEKLFCSWIFRTTFIVKCKPHCAGSVASSKRYVGRKLWKTIILLFENGIAIRARLCNTHLFLCVLWVTVQMILLAWRLLSGNYKHVQEGFCFEIWRNISLYCLHMTFIEEYTVARLPLHIIMSIPEHASGNLHARVPLLS